MTDEEIKQLAEDIYKGLVFTDRHIYNSKDISTIFMPLALMGDKELKEFRANSPGMLYEYMDKACNMAINSMPIFFSLRWIDQKDAKKVMDRYNKILDAVNQI